MFFFFFFLLGNRMAPFGSWRMCAGEEEKVEGEEVLAEQVQAFTCRFFGTIGG